MEAAIKDLRQKTTNTLAKAGPAADLSGSWTFESSSDNFEDFLSAMDVGFMKRKAIANIKPDILIRQRGNKFEITTKTHVKDVVLRFTVGEVFVDEQNPLFDGPTKTTINWEGSHLVQRYHDSDKGLLTSRFIENGKLVVAQKVGSVRARRVFIKS